MNDLFSRRQFLTAAGVAAASIAAPRLAASQEAPTAIYPPPGSWLTLESFGARGDGQTPDDAALEALLQAAGQGGDATIYLPGIYRLTRKAVIQGKSLKFIGRSSLGDSWSGFAFDQDGEIELRNCNGGIFENVGFRAQAGFRPEHDLVSMVDTSLTTFYGVQFDGSQADGVRYLRATGNSNGTRFINIRARGARGEYGFYLGGPLPADTKTGANIFDFSVFSIGAEGNCDAIVFDGSSGSARFSNGAMNFGRRAVWAKSTGFLYFSACGWENHSGDYTLQFDRAKNVSITGCYINGGLQIGEECSDFRVSSCTVSAAAFHGCEIGGMQVSLAGNIIRRNSVSEKFEYSGVKLLKSCVNVSVTDNVIAQESIFSKQKGANVQRNALQRYAIDSDAPSDRGNLISGNVLTEYTEAPIGGSVSEGPHIFGNRFE